MNDSFLKKYDDGSLKFDKIRFRDGAAFTLDFGIYSKKAGDFLKQDLSFPDERSVYVHFGVDRAHGVIICPFDSTLKWSENVPGYGTLLRIIPVGADFEIRVAHMSRLTLQAKRAAESCGFIESGVMLGKTGSAGIGTGPHSHTEIVSIGTTSVICDGILAAKGFTLRNTIADAEDRMTQAEKYEFLQYASARDLIMMNAHQCVRNDSFIPKGRVTYYSSRSLFGM